MLTLYLTAMKFKGWHFEVDHFLKEIFFYGTCFNSG